MNVLTNGVLDLAEHEVREIAILRLQEANVVGRVDQAVTGDLELELVFDVTLNAVEEAAHDLLMLVLHLHVVDL